MGQDLSKLARLECSDGAHQNPHVEAICAARSDLEVEEAFVTPPSTPANSSSSLTRTPIIIFDWDDTLMCTSAVNQQTVTAEELAELERAVDSILHTSMALGETMVVTNGNATWVNDSASRFLPRLLPTLARVRVVSARALFECSFPGDPYKWKKAAFKHLLVKERYATREVGLNLVVLGDQMPEIDAAYDVLKDLQAPSCAKTLKFKERPSIVELIGQIRRTERELSMFVAEETSGHRCLKRLEQFERSAIPASDAAVWGLTDKTTGASDFSPRACHVPPSLKDVWPFFS